MNINFSIGDWEKSTNAIGSKLLMQMGWKPGQGVGKDGKGISTPVEAKLRIGKGAIGELTTIQHMQQYEY